MHPHQIIYPQNNIPFSGTFTFPPTKVTQIFLIDTTYYFKYYVVKHIIHTKLQQI